MLPMKRLFITVVLPLVALTTIFYFAEVLRSSGGHLYKYIHEYERTEIFDPSAIFEQPITSNRVLEKLNQGKSGEECNIKILVWRKPGKEQQELGLDEWQKATCTNRISCNIEMKYSNRFENIPVSDIVIIMPGPFKNFKWSKLLQTRPPGQQWVLYSRESPVHEPQFSPPLALTKENPYNFTATFRSDSDECITWGYYYPGHPSVPAATRMDWTKGKTKLMVWVASRCDPLGWERTKIVKEIQKSIPVDIYGRCGPLECPKRDKECANTFRDYKFYLSLENSECKEYITEKFWNNGFGNNMIPIVYGAPKEDYEKFAPPHSFIHLSDFATMEEFVDYIHLLDKNDTLYNEYFHWKAKGGWTTGPGHRTTLSPAGICTIVKLLKSYAVHPEKSWRFKNPDFHKWWEDSCSSHKELLGVKISLDRPLYMEDGMGEWREAKE